MSPIGPVLAVGQLRLPRTCGDEPTIKNAPEGDWPSAPHLRG